MPISDDPIRHLSDIEGAMRSLVGEGSIVVGGGRVTSEMFDLWLKMREKAAVQDFSKDFIGKAEAFAKERDQLSEQLNRERLDRATERDFAKREYDLRIQQLELNLRTEYGRRLEGAIASISREAQRLVPINERAALNDHLARKGIDVAALAVGKLLGFGGTSG